MKRKVISEYIFEDLGFPIKLVDVPMVQLMGEWALDINLNELQRVVADCLALKRAPLTGAEVQFLRKYFHLTKSDFARMAGVTHAAVVKWEKHRESSAKIGMASETCIRLYALEKLHEDSQEFLALYKMVVLRHADKLESATNPILINAKEELDQQEIAG